MKTFESGQSSILNEHKTKDCVGWWPFSTPRFAPSSAPLKFAEFCNHSPLLTMGYMGLLFNFHTLYEFRFSDWLICTT